MVPTTRRRFLSGTATFLAVIAGCNDSSDSPSRSEPPRREDVGNVERDPETHLLRAPIDDPVAWLPHEDRGDTETTADAGTPPTRGRQRGLVESADAAARLRFADVDGAEEARRFVERTDFDDETVYFETRSVRECYELELCYVTWSAQKIQTSYGSHYRDAEVHCDEDGEDATAWFVRIPDALDPNSVSGYGSGWSSNGCRYPPYLRTTTERTTDEVVAHPVTANATDASAEEER